MLVAIKKNKRKGEMKEATKEGMKNERKEKEITEENKIVISRKSKVG